MTANTTMEEKAKKTLFDHIDAVLTSENAAANGNKIVASVNTGLD